MHIRNEKFIGQTNYSKTYFAEATLRNLEIDVVVKKIISDDDVQNFDREVRALAMNSAPNIVKMMGYDIDKKEIYFENIKGEVYSDFLARGQKISISQSMSILADMASSVASVHNSTGNKPSFVHYDISGGNFIIDSNGTAVLIDFGTAYAIDEIPNTYYGMEIGTLEYMSPEKINGLPHFGKESDVYSLGVLAYQTIEGMSPFMECVGNIRGQILNDEPLPINSGIVTIDNAVMKCLSKNPKERPKASELAIIFSEYVA